MTECAKKVWRALNEEFERTGNVDYCNAATLSGLSSAQADLGVNQLEALGYIKKNILGEAALTKSGIACFVE